MDNIVWTLRDLSHWADNSSSETAHGKKVSIPAIQRGLVWKPGQVELLWDSILRGFPIGSFTLSYQNLKDGFELLDGQQRWNAIALGFGTFVHNVEDPASVVWLDLCGEEFLSSHVTTRKYLIRVTTTAHPWGYKADDSAGLFNTAQKHAALKSLGYETFDPCTDKLSLRRTYPVESMCPLPLFWFLDAINECDGTRENFVEKVKSKISSSDFRLKEDAISLITNERIARFFDVFNRTKSFEISCIYLDQTIINENSDQIVDDKFGIEVLFERLGKGGTPITPAELMYSSIKSHWAETIPNIKEETDALAAKYMPAYTLIQLAFRLAISSDDELKSVDLKKIRETAQDKDNLAVAERFKALYDPYDSYSSKLAKILELVNSWLTIGRDNIPIPAVLRTSIARKSPDVYLLLMAFADRSVSQDITYSDEDIDLFRSTAYYIHWFCDKNIRLVNNIFKATSKTSQDLKKVIRKCLAEWYRGNLDQLYKGKYKMIPLVPFERFKNLFGDTISEDAGWRPWGNDLNREDWWPLWKKICENRELLIYAQRQYMNKRFEKYDPAREDMWEDSNRPWDYDHIIPQDWIHVKNHRRISFTDYCLAWKDTNGNMAAIPFSINRSKSNISDWSEYNKNLSELLLDEVVESWKIDPHLTADGKQAHTFATKTFERICRIYKQILDLLEPVNINSSDDENLSCSELTYKEIVEKICDGIGGTKYCLGVYSKDWEIKNKIDWYSRWITVGCKVGEFFPALTIDVNNDGIQSFEIGLRRLPGSDVDPKIPDTVDLSVFDKFKALENSYWWSLYYQTDIVSELNDIEHIITLLKQLKRCCEGVNN